LARFPQLALVAILVGACGHAASRPPAAATPSAHPGDALVGTWDLRTFADAPPTAHNIKTYEVAFLPDHTWTFSAVMTGDWEGMRMEGSGSWSVDAGQLDYTAGANSGSSVISWRDGSLVLDPDPVLRDQARQPGTAVYDAAADRPEATQ